MIIDAWDLDLALDELAMFEEVELALHWHELLSVWFSGSITSIVLC